MADRATTREKLVEMRERLIGNLGRQIEGGDLTLLATINGALAAIDAEALPIDAEPMVRAVVTDVPGEPVALSLYGEDGSVAVVTLDPIRAINLASRLLDAALRRLR